MWIVDCKQVFAEKFHESDEAHTLGSLFHTLQIAFYSWISNSISIRDCKAWWCPDDVWTASELTHPVSLVSQFKKLYVKFVVDIASVARGTELEVQFGAWKLSVSNGLSMYTPPPTSWNCNDDVIF